MERRDMKWLRRGCLGCLAFVGLGVVAVALLLMLPLVLGHPDSDPVTEEHIPDLPPSPVSPPDPPAPAPPDSPSPEGVTLPPEAFPGAEEALRVNLDLSAGSFRIEPGTPGDRLRVEADYDRGRFYLEQRFDEGSNTYRVSFGMRGGWLGLFRGSVEGDNRVRILVPPDRPFALDGKVGLGESHFELGGLWITDVDLELGAGEHNLLVSEPLKAPLERIKIHGSIGETNLRSLGNASPTRVEVHQGIGEMSIDLHGAWQRDSLVTVDLGIGECRVRTPEDVGVYVERSSVGIGEARSPQRREAPPGAPTLTLRLSGGIGELSVH